MDKENTDTWKHKQAGANLVVGVGSTTFFNVRKEHDLNRILYLLKHFDDFDFVIIEGYKSYNYPKIITSPEVRDEYTIKEVDSFTIDDEGVSYFSISFFYSTTNTFVSRVRTTVSIVTYNGVSPWTFTNEYSSFVRCIS